VLLTRLPLTPKGAFDLHVLSLPPAFVLSQDQTLKFKEFNLDCVTTQIDRAPLTPAFPPERCTHQKHRSGRCLLSKVAKATRKDTAAYASLSRLHLSKSTAPQPRRQTDRHNPPAKPEEGDRLSRKPNRARLSDGAVDEPDISSPQPPVNPNPKEILRSAMTPCPETGIPRTRRPPRYLPGQAAPVLRKAPNAKHSVPVVDGRFISPGVFACQQPYESFLTVPVFVGNMALRAQPEADPASLPTQCGAIHRRSRKALAGYRVGGRSLVCAGAFDCGRARFDPVRQRPSNPLRC
jgi:hypothetical protein